MFSLNEIELMKILEIDVDFDNLTDDDLEKIKGRLTEMLRLCGFDSRYNVTMLGRSCERIVKKISEYLENKRSGKSVGLKTYMNKHVKIVDIDDQVFMGLAIDYVPPKKSYGHGSSSDIERIVIKQDGVIEFTSRDIKLICVLDEGENDPTESIAVGLTCPSCYNKMIYRKETGHYCCGQCSFTLSQESFMGGYLYWFCDKCEMFLNLQDGFNTDSGIWKCRRCGFENDVRRVVLKEKKKRSKK